MTRRRRTDRPPIFSARCLLAITGTCAVVAGSPATGKAELDLDLYAALLGEYTVSTETVAGTRVDYAGIAADPRWPRLLAGLESARPSGFSRERDRKSFWINAYNVLAIRMVVEHAPLESIRDAGSLWWPVWRREIARIEGARITLDGIERGILRKTGDPRIHGAIVCASTSCPSLARAPYRSRDLEAQLDAAMRHFLANPRKGLRIDRSRNTVVLSQIFRWSAEDFEVDGGVLAFAIRYAPESDHGWLTERRDDLDIEYFDYDWGLNAWRR